MRLRFFALAAVWILAACAAPAAPPTQVAVTASISTLAPATPTNTPVLAATPEATPNAITLTLWWPEPLAPIDNQAASNLLVEQIRAFEAANSDVTVNFRLKNDQDVGGIMSTLKTASLVAPGALPDLTLLRRSDMIAAAQAGLIMPLDEHAEASILDNLHPMVSALGRVNDRLYGLPYNVEVEHMVYQAGKYALDRWSFANVLAQKAAFVFAAGRANSLSDVFLVQYRDATGTLESSTISPDADQLRTLFQFYQQAVSEKLIDPTVLQYVIPDDFRGGLVQGDIPAGVVTSTLYLRMIAEGAKLDYAPIPTVSGEPTTVVDSWMWVLTSADSEQQMAAMRFLNWMQDADRQGKFNQTIDMLPSQRSALRQWEDPDYAAFIDTLLNNATMPLTESSSGVAARTIQSALASVINGQRSAEQATQDVMTQLSG
ncbi:MAG TPA: extracellular solute-binding protein [Phototrophicaceae bacterium]|nr:extracellular solute-binding protein [Phototrophicaceae bacterium]